MAACCFVSASSLCLFVLIKKKSSQVLYALCSSCFTIGPAEDHEKWADAVNSECACADEHKRDDAVLQQPHDVLTDQHQASAGHKPKTHRRRVQPRRTATVRALKRVGGGSLLNQGFFLFCTALSSFCNRLYFLQHAPQPANADTGSHHQCHLTAFPVQHVSTVQLDCIHTHTHTPVCSTSRLISSSSPAHRYTLEQQIIAPSFSMQQVNCNAVLVPSPVFTSPIMIPHNSFMANQSQSAYHTQPQTSQHSLQLQQPQQFFQVPGLFFMQ